VQPSRHDVHVIEIPGYRLLRQLGRGGMSTVYLAVQESVDREVALKVMSPALLADPDFGARFQREARIAARLHHRHVVGIYDVGRAGERHYIAMEYLAGGPVLPKDGGALDAAFALRVVREIATALDYAHGKGFVHRDVKPDNILLRDDFSAALTDFGIARALDAAPRVTRTGTIVGTPHYMSPEQARGREIDGRADLYSLGVVLYEMLVGRVPYHADDSLAIGIMHITEPVPTLPDALAHLQQLLARMLAKQPEERFQSGQELARAIAALEQRLADAEAPGSMAMSPEPRRVTPESLFAIDVAAGDAPRERAEPSLGRLDDLIDAIDDGGTMRAARETSHARARAPRRWRGLGTAVVLFALAVGAWSAWTHQDALRRLVPRTEFNDTLTRAQRALDSGHLTGTGGDSARELFLAARAQDPDNDTARRGIDEVGRRLLQQADAALARGDAAGARAPLDAARELLGGGAEVERVEQALKQAKTQDGDTARGLERARRALDEGRVAGSDGAAALYRHVLDGDHSNALAQAGLTRSADVLAEQARDALRSGDVAVATARSDEIARFLPAYPALPGLLGEIAKAREAAHAALDSTLDLADSQVRAGNLTDGDGSALALYRRVLADDPSSARAREGLHALGQAFVVRANAAIDSGNADEAARLLASAAALAPDSPDLRAARAALRELHERMDIDAARATVTPEQVLQVRRLVAEGARAAAAGNLVIPPGDSAYDKYRAALAVDRDDAAAQDGLARLPARARELFEQALTQGTLQRALALLDAVRTIAPEDKSIGPMSERLARAFLDQADARLGEGRRADAASALESARQLSPGNPRLAPLRARLRAMDARTG
jgi:serine/threonine-protein kinase PpkA